MILVDTSVWINFFRHPDTADSDRLVEYLENGIAVGLSAVFGELLQGVKTEDEGKLVLEFWNSIPKVNESNLFIDAGKLSREYKLMENGVGLIECYLLAAARNNRYNIWTSDRKLNEAFALMKI